MSVVSSRRNPSELCERAVRMVAESRGAHRSEWARRPPLGDTRFNVHGRYAFTEAANDQLRPLRDPRFAKDD